MPKRNPAQEILERLDAFVADGGIPPVLPDGKVNVTGLCKLLGFRPSDAQYFHKSEDVKGAVNALCADHGIFPIGHRSQSEEDTATNARLVQARRAATNDARAAAEQSAASEAVLQELHHTAQQLERVKLERDSLAARLAIIESGGIPPRL